MNLEKYCFKIGFAAVVQQSKISSKESDFLKSKKINNMLMFSWIVLYLY